MQVQFEYFQNKFIEFELHDMNFFVGPNREIKHQLLKTITRMKKQKSLNTLEQNYYNNDGININSDGTTITNKNTKFMIVTSANDFINEFIIDKDSLINQFLSSISDEFEIQKELTKLNDNLIRIESIIQNKINELDENNNLNLEMNLFDYNTIIKKQLCFSFYLNKNPESCFPLEFVSIKLITNLFIQILDKKISETDHPYWLFLSNLNQIFDSNEEINEFIQQLRRMTFEHRMFKVFIFMDSCPNFKMNQNDIERTIYIGDFVEQLPEFDILKRSVALHYPVEFNLSKSELVNQFYRIINYVGEKIDKNVYLSPKDMILLNVLQEIL